jgi:prepilin-type N-terminal cleavage/methylation domain-containing protein
MDSSSRDDSGFTLVEIVIAIVLVGILSAVVVVGIGRLTEQGAAAGCAASADAARAATTSYYATNLTYPATIDQLVTGTHLTLSNGVTTAGTTATGPGWTMTMTPGASGAPPTFTCNSTGNTATATVAPSGTTACPGTYTGWTAEYYNGITLTGTPLLCRDDPSLNFNWASGSPATAIPANRFSARWTRNITFTAGDHTFTVGSDDGHRLYIDGTLVLDTWRDQAYTTRTVTRTLTAGPHRITLEYYENGGLAQATLTWT